MITSYRKLVVWLGIYMLVGDLEELWLRLGGDFLWVDRLECILITVELERINIEIKKELRVVCKWVIFILLMWYVIIRQY